MHEEGAAAQAAQSFAYERRKDSAVIWRCFSRDTKAEIPPELDGLPVTEIAPYAFSAHMDVQSLRGKTERGELFVYAPEGTRGQMSTTGKLTVCGAADGPTAFNDAEEIPPLCGSQLEELVLPRTLRRVGRYCFYDCGNFARLTFHGGLTDWGSGVFTRCHRIRKLCVYADEDGRSHLKDVLDELPEALQVDYFFPCGGSIPEHSLAQKYERASLVFPEFYEEGVENTPARILETHVHGSGISYRNCFQGRTFDFAQYDALFPHARALESDEVVAGLVTGRLKYPAGLSEKARLQYEAYVRDNASKLGRWLLENRDLEGVRLLLELMKKEEALLGELTEAASRLRYTEAVGFLMSCRQSGAAKKRKRLEL